MSNEQKEKLREKFLSDENPGKNKSKETIEKISKNRTDKCKGINHPMYGKHHTEETKKYWSEIRKGKNVGVENKTTMKYYILTPKNDTLIFIGKKEVINHLGCSVYFFTIKKYKGFKLIKKENIHPKGYWILDEENNEKIFFNTRKEVINHLGCSQNIFKTKRYKNYKIL